MSYIGNSPTTTAFVTDTFNGDGSTVAFNMSVAPANTTSILVIVTGVVQDPNTYSVLNTTLTFSAAPPSGTGNISVRYLGIPASGVTTTAYRTVTEFTATAGQTSFSVPSYTVGFIDVYRNGVRLGSSDFTASNGTTVVLASGASAGDLVVTESFYVSSVLNAIPATAGAVNSTYIADNAVNTAEIAAGAVTQTKLATGVAGTGPAFSACLATSNQSVTAATFTKVAFNSVIFDTASAWDAVNYRFKPLVAGYYQINATIMFGQSGGTGNTAVTQIRKNGVSVGQNELVWSYNNASSLSVSHILYLNGSTDYVEIYGYNNAASSPVFISNTDNTFFSAALVRAA